MMNNALLLLPHLNIQNANTISSPLTHGFPSITAFLGLMWALERRLKARFGVRFTGIGVVCHQHQAQRSGSYVQTFNLTRNPVNQHGDTVPIVEEGRIHLDISLVLGVAWQDFSPDIDSQLASATLAALSQMRVAGGSVLPSRTPHQPVLYVLEHEAEADAATFRRLRRKLLPGFALISRDDLLHSEHHRLLAQQPEANLFDAWLQASRLNMEWIPQVSEATSAPDAETTDSKPKGKWGSVRHFKGWVVPIPVGYTGLAAPMIAGQLENARDTTTPSQFVECVYSLAEWRSPHRLQSWQDLLWHSHHDPATHTYRALNQCAFSAPVDEDY
jgi:CRISPR-associated protein Csy2